MVTNIEEVTIVKDNDLGGQLNPVSNNKELLKAILGRKNCYIYTKGTFQVTEQNLYELKVRNIKLVGLSFAYLSKEIEKVVLSGTSDISLKGLMSELSKSETRYINGNK
jgi:hypothetical protein